MRSAIEALVDDCKNTLAHENSDSAQPYPHDDGATMGQEGESYSESKAIKFAGPAAHGVSDPP